jgi:hypothetical protein
VDRSAQEINADIAAIGACLSSPNRRLREQGWTFTTWPTSWQPNDYLKGLGLPVNLSTTNAELLGSPQWLSRPSRSRLPP